MCSLMLKQLGMYRREGRLHKNLLMLKCCYALVCIIVWRLHGQRVKNKNERRERLSHLLLDGENRDVQKPKIVEWWVLRYVG